MRRVRTYVRSTGRILVELHKKFSIPFASIVFILIGAPLGMISKKSGFSMGLDLQDIPDNFKRNSGAD